MEQEEADHQAQMDSEAQAEYESKMAEAEIRKQSENCRNTQCDCHVLGKICECCIICKHSDSSKDVNK